MDFRDKGNLLTISSCCLFVFDSFLVGAQIDIASTPDGNGLHKQTVLFAALHVANNVDPGTNFQFMNLDAFQDMGDVDICCFCDADYGVVVLQSKGCCRDHIFINTGTIQLQLIRLAALSVPAQKADLSPL